MAIKNAIHGISVIAYIVMWPLCPFIRIYGFLRKRRGSRVRSLWSGAPIINMAMQARAERLMGIEVKTLVFHTYYITDAFDYNLSRFSSNSRLHLLLRYAVFIWTCLYYDRLHFFMDQGIMPQISPWQFNPYELKIYRKLNKQLFFWTYGGDVRTTKETKALGEPNCCMDCPSTMNCSCDSDVSAVNYGRIKSAATGMFSMGDMIEYTPGSRNDLFFWPVDLKEDDGNKYAPAYPDPDGMAPVKVVHAPNHRYFKGTDFLLAAVERIRKDGIPVELILVERVPNKEALAIYRSADIIFDQCLVGFHGYFTIEAMAMGKPVMCFIRDPQRYLIHHEECPIVNARCDRVETVLRELVMDRKRLNDLGKRGRRYVENYFTIEAFSGRLRQAYIDLGVMQE